MARSYTNIFCAIWDDEEFCALSSDAQRTYFMLVTQADITACGTLALRLRRWAKTLPGRDRHSLEPALKELIAEGFAIVDEDFEELLVRTFVKHDGGHKHSQRVKAVIAYAEAIKSSRIRTAMAVELRKLSVNSALDSLLSPTGQPLDTDPSPTEQEPRSGRSVVTEVVTTTLHTPHSESALPTPAGPGAADLVPSDTAQTIIGRWIEHCRARPPQTVIGQVSKSVKALLAEGIDARHVERGLAEWARKGIHPSTLPSVVNEVMNAPPTLRRATTDRRALEGLEVAAQLRAGGE